MQDNTSPSVVVVSSMLLKVVITLYCGRGRLVDLPNSKSLSLKFGLSNSLSPDVKNNFTFWISLKTESS